MIGDEVVLEMGVGNPEFLNKLERFFDSLIHFFKMMDSSTVIALIALICFFLIMKNVKIPSE